jgi:hypothetical protein
MKAKEFDRKFDEGENIVDQLDFAKARRPEQERNGSMSIFRCG